MQQSDMTVIYLCNAVDEMTKKERNVRFDSPAATNKVIGIGKALQTQNVKVFILSLGRGKQIGDGTKFPTIARKVSGIPILYSAFWHYPFVTHIIGALSMSILLMRLLRNRSGRVVIIAYNRLWHYLPTLILAAIFRKHCYLDLEDGTIESDKYIRRLLDFISQKLFDSLCNKGALVAAKSLKEQLNTKRVFVCYGCADITTDTSARWDIKPIRILFGGSLLAETGVPLLIDTVEFLEKYHSHLMGQLIISVTGQGLMEEQLVKFSKSKGKGWINYFGNIDREAYIRLLKYANIGLCLKMSSTDMGKTTFPSKIIEYASYGLLVISTKVSDVPDLLSNNYTALLVDETPESIVNALITIISNKNTAKNIAWQGRQKIQSVCNSESVGKDLANYLQQGYEA